MPKVLIVSYIVYADPVNIKDCLIARQFKLNGFLIIGAYRIETVKINVGIIN